MKRLLKGLGRAWCSLFHPNPMWPIHGCYQCSRCFRSYQVQWDR
jgi:hypothetical protein